jgi:transcription-repair coupling factor (superfamily II helicase)
VERGPSILERWLLNEVPLPEAGVAFCGLTDTLKALVTATLVEQSEAPNLIVFPSGSAARAFVDAFRFFAGKASAGRIHYLPAVDFDFYRSVLPNPTTLCERNVGLFHALNDPKRRVFVTTAAGILQKVFPSSEFMRATRTLKLEEEIDRDALLGGLVEAGYQRQPAATDPGVFAVRGNVIDVFSPLYPHPVRLEFFGDWIQEIRFFEPDTQRSLDPLPEVTLLPVGQSLLPRGQDFELAFAKVKERLDSSGIAKVDREVLLEKIQNGSLPAEASFLFPLLSGGSEVVTEYFPSGTRFILAGQSVLNEVAEQREIPRLENNHRLFESQPLPIAAYSDLFLKLEEFKSVLTSPTYVFETFQAGENGLFLETKPVHLEAEREKALKSATGSLDGFAAAFREWIDQGYRVHIVFHTRTHAERFRGLFEPYHFKMVSVPEESSAQRDLFRSDFQTLSLWQGYLSESAVLPGLKTVLLSEEVLFGQKKRTSQAKRRSSASTDRLLSQFREMQVGDFVVHKEFGIARYLGLKTMPFLGVDNDYVLLEYRDGDKLYIPIYRLNVLQKYVSGESGSPVLDKLGTDRWAKAKGKAKRAIAELAAELMKLQAKRKLIPAFAFSEPSAEYRQFEMEFPFDETPDQMKAIDEVMEDLSKSYPMDRLICGDVGYGKTEVAMRAAFRVVDEQKQVAVLVPTTVLAFQHFESFKNRFRNVGVRIELISRMRKPAEVKKVLADVKEGKVDILVGTHRLLSSDIQFKDLGLVVIDEEHRFGVTDKEKLKKLRDSVHVLAMTATPIPRTLNMAMSGIKEISIITTPPPDRLSVRTFVCRSSPEVISEAISNELGRGGQVYFVHNRVETLGKIAQEIKELLPKVVIETGHGQMDGEVLEQKMLTFYKNEAQILICTTIIESGIDIPRANTILIDRADCLGLAQLYQLRGRVGRSDRRAYCYLLTPGETQMTEDAKERLQVLQRYSELGSGFHIASHDLEIRGSGDLLGKDQSGHIAAVGVDLYFELLEESVATLQGAPDKIDIEPEITLKVRASFPTEYLPDVGERVVLYRRLSSVETEDEIADIETEIRDRFGTPPDEVLNLLGLMKIKVYLKALHVTRMSCGPKRTSLQFAPSTPASPEKLVRLVSKHSKDYSITPDQKLVFSTEAPEWPEQLKQVQRIAVLLGVASAGV